MYIAVKTIIAKVRSIICITVTE